MTAPPFIVLSKQDLTVLMPFGEYVDAVADAFRMHTEGRSIAPAPTPSTRQWPAAFR